MKEVIIIAYKKSIVEVRVEVIKIKIKIKKILQPRRFRHAYS